MSLQIKQQLVSEVRDDIGEFLTYKQTNQVSDILLDRLCGYEVEQTQIGEIDSNSMDLLQSYLDAKAVQGLSPGTLEGYRYKNERMLRDVGVPVQKITVNHLRNYLMQEKGRGISDRTLENDRSKYSAFFGWLQNEGLIRVNPCANIGTIKYIKKLREPYSPVERLNREDIDFHALECKVLGKGNKERTVYIDEVTAMVLQQYFDIRTDTSPALFGGIRRNRTDRISPHGVRDMLTKLGERVDVENVHPHRFRRTLATTLILHGMPIQEVAMILGHTSINTTMTYVKVNQESVKSSYRRFFYS